MRARFFVSSVDKSPKLDFFGVVVSSHFIASVSRNIVSGLSLCCQKCITHVTRLLRKYPRRDDEVQVYSEVKLTKYGSRFFFDVVNICRPVLFYFSHDLDACSEINV